LKNQTENYEELWKKAENLIKEDKPESARSVVQKIYNKAKSEKNVSHWFKSLCYLYYLSSLKDEFPEELNHAHLQKEVKSAPFPLNALLYSLLAESELQYLNSNFWKFSDMSYYPDEKSDSIQHWDIQAISRNILKNYQASIEAKEKLSKIPVEEYAYILMNVKEEGKKYRPTLYDILAHRALDGLLSGNLNLGLSGETTDMTDAKWFAATQDFIGLTYLKQMPSSPDKHFLFFSLLRDMMEVHKMAQRTDALFDLELERLHYLKNNSLHPEKWNELKKLIHNLKKEFKEERYQDALLYKEASFLIEQGNAWKKGGNDSLRWKLKEAVRLLEKIKDKESRYGKMAYNEYHSLTRPQIQSIQTEGANEPGKPSLILAKVKNVSSLYFRILSCPAEAILYWEQYGYDMRSWPYKINQMNVVTSFTRKWNLPDDYQWHNVEIDIPALETGNYLLQVSLNPEFKEENSIMAFVPLIFTRTGMLMLERKKEQVYWFTDRFSGKSIENKEMIMYKQEYNYKTYRYDWREDKKIKTNSTGEFSLEKKSGVNYSIRFKYEENGKWFYTPTGYLSSYYEWRNPKSIQSAIFTDRAIYRPGQTVYFKGIVWENSPENSEKNVLAGHQIRVELLDVNGENRGSLSLTTNDFGSYSGSFRIPAGLLNGNFRIQDGYSVHNIKVEEYKRPTFYVTLRLPDYEYELNDSVDVTGIVKAYSGQSLNNCKIRYTVKRRAIQYYTYGWWSRCFVIPEDETEKVLTTGNSLSNDTGFFRIRFFTKPDLSLDPDKVYYEYIVQTEVTDISGETHEEEVSLHAGKHSVKLSLDVPEKVSNKQAVFVSYRASNLNGRMLSVPVEITLFKVLPTDNWKRSKIWNTPDIHSLDSAEYVKMFPMEEFGNENDVFLRKREKVKSWTITTQKEKSENLEIAKPKELPQGEYIVQIKTKSAKGMEIKEERSYILFDEEATLPPLQTPMWHESDSAVVLPGKKFNFKVKSSFAGIPVKYFIQQKEGVGATSLLKPGAESVQISITENHRGNIGYNLACVFANRLFQHTQIIYVPLNKELKTEILTFRDKTQPGSKEEWKIKITDKDGKVISSELLTGMYDASLDVFAENNWNLFPRETFYPYNAWQNFLGNTYYSVLFDKYPVHYKTVLSVLYPKLNTFYYQFYYGYRYRGRMYDKAMREEVPTPAMAAVTQKPKSEGARDERTINGKDNESTGIPGNTRKDVDKTKPKDSSIPVRKNLNETAFFFPELKTNEKGEVYISFTMPEALTTWKWLGLAHTKDLKTGTFVKTLITSKDLMIQPNMPRFFREGDHMSLRVKVSNVTSSVQAVSCKIKILDPETDADITKEFLSAGESHEKKINVRAGVSETCAWELEIPSGKSWVNVRVSAGSEQFTDAEEHSVPVLSNRIFLTQSMPFWLKAKSSSVFTFEALKNNTSSTLKHHRITLEWTPNPVWNAVQALPYIMEYPYECAEQTFSRFYANTLASHITDKMPKIKQVFHAWKNSKDALLSALEKNQDLKLCLLEESPWVLEAKEESMQKERIALLFDLNKMSDEKQKALDKLLDIQTENGGFPWFKGGPDNWFITQYIVEGMGHLIRLGAFTPEKRILQMIQRAIHYCDLQIKKEYEYIKKYDKEYLKKDHLSYTIIHYLYARSFFMNEKITDGCSEAYSYFDNQALHFWKEKSVYMKSMLAMYHHRKKNLEAARSIMASIKEYSLFSEEMGRYWKFHHGWYWYEQPVETQAMIIEALEEVEGNKQWADECRIWLLRQKQTQHWSNTRSTAEAVYALLLRGSEGWEKPSEWSIEWGGQTFRSSDPSVEKTAGSGYARWDEDLKNKNAQLYAQCKVENKGNSVAWGALYWQYWEDMDKVSSSGASGLKAEKQLFRVNQTANGVELEALGGDVKAKIGDRLRIRVRLMADRNYEFVHLKDQRAACLEPVQNLSGYQWQNGLGYYQNMRDASCNFFFDYLPKGTYTFEYDVFVNASGEFSQGPTQVQCMYAPEFGSQTGGYRLKALH